LKAFIDWDIAERIIKDRENKILRQAQANKKKRSKKIILLTVINTDTWDKYKEQLLNKEINNKRKNAGPKNNRKGK
jgi:predicted transcriptional regulator